MRKGDAVIILPTNPILGQHGVQFAHIIAERENDVDIQLCCQSKVILKSPKHLLAIVDYDQVPRELQRYLPTNKMSDNELRVTLERIERKLTQIGVKLGLTPLPGDPTAF